MQTIPFRERISCSVNEAISAAGIGRTKLYEWISEGRIRTSMAGAKRLVIVASLIEAIESDTRKAA